MTGGLRLRPVQARREVPIALAAGLVASSTVTGLFFASLGFTVGLERDTARGVAAGLMAATGAVLLVPRLQDLVGRLATPLATGAGALLARRPPGLRGQVVLGVLLGAVWTPCTGPTLAAAVALAAQSESLPRAGLVMLVFSLGAVAPVLLLAYGSRHAALGRGVALSGLAALGKPTLGVLLLLVGALALTGADKVIEAWMVDHMPGWLLDLTTEL